MGDDEIMMDLDSIITAPEMEITEFVLERRMMPSSAARIRKILGYLPHIEQRQIDHRTEAVFYLRSKKDATWLRMCL